MRGCVQRTKPRVRGQIPAGVMVDMRRPIIHDQMNPAGVRPTPRDLAQGPEELFVIVGVKTARPHRPIKHIKGDQQRHRAMSFILELTSHDLPRTHGLRRRAPRQGLNVGLLINTNHHFAALAQPPHPLIAPQHRRRPRRELFINGGRLPISTAMRLQAGRRQDARHRRVVNRVHDGPLDHHLLEGATVPAGQMQTIRGRIGAGDALDPDSFQRGKNRVAARCVRHQRWLRRPAPSSAAINTRGRCGLLPSTARSQRCVRRDPTPTGPALDWQPVESFDHWSQPHSSSVYHSRSVCIRLVYALSSRSLSPCGEVYVSEREKSICSSIYATVH